MSQDKLNSIKQQTKLEINKLNKLVNDYKNKEKNLDTEYKKREENLNKNFQEKQTKLNAKLNKREARKIKKIKKKITKTLSTQTDTTKVEMKSIQTEQYLNPVLQDFTIVKQSIQNTIDKFLTPNTSEISTQCNLTKDKIVKKSSNNFDIDFYLLSYFRKIDRDNRSIKSVVHIDENTEVKYRRNMLGALDTNEDIYKMLFTEQYCGDISIRFYSSQEELFSIKYLHKHKMSNQLLIRSKKYKKINGNNNKINMKFREFYKIELEGSNGKYMIKFNGKDILEINIDKEIKFFCSNSNFKMIYT